MNLVKIGILAGIFLLLNILLIYLEKSALQIRNQNYLMSQRLNYQNGGRNQRSCKQIGGESGERVVFDATIDYVGKKQTVAGQIQKALLDNPKLVQYLPKEFNGQFLDKLTTIIIADAVKILKENKLIIDLNSDRIANLYQRLSAMAASPNEVGAAELKRDFETIFASPDYLEFIQRIIMDTNLYRLIMNTIRIENGNLAVLSNNLTNNFKTAVERFPVKDQSGELKTLWTNLKNKIASVPTGTTTLTGGVNQRILPIEEVYY